MVHCEKVTGGNENILNEPPFTEKKEVKVDYTKIFGDGKDKDKKDAKDVKSKKEEKVKKDINGVNSKKVKKSILDKSKEATPAKPVKSSDSTKKSKKAKEVLTPARQITHPRFLQGSDHKVRILTQPSTPYHLDNQTGDSSPKAVTPNYRCQMCDFAASRLNVIVLHSKTHSASKVSYAVKNMVSSPKVERTKSEGSSSLTPSKTPAKTSAKTPAKASAKRERPVTKHEKKSATAPNKKPR